MRGADGKLLIDGVPVVRECGPSTYNRVGPPKRRGRTAKDPVRSIVSDDVDVGDLE